MPFEVDQDGTVGPALAQRPVVDAHDMRPASPRQRHALDRAQHGGGARRHGEMRQQSGGGLATKREAGSGMSLGEAAGALRLTAEQTREALGKGAARAARMAAGEAAHRQIQPDELAADRQVGSPSPVARVHRGADGPAIRAAGVVAPTLGADDEAIRTIARDAKQAATGEKAEGAHALICAPATAQTRRRPSPHPCHQTRR